MRDNRCWYCDKCNTFTKRKGKITNRVKCGKCHNYMTFYCYAVGNNHNTACTIDSNGHTRGMIYRVCAGCKFRFVCITCGWGDACDYFEQLNKWQ